ncbi:MAG: ABC transporter ATP-binding protein [Burkholderiaceae bacterium]
MSIASAKASHPAYLDIRQVSKKYGSLTVVRELDLSIRRGELVSLLGPSGCGKTTLLRLIAGLVKTEAGTIKVGERDLTRVAAHKRNISVVFQNYALFPHLNVRENVAFGLQARSHPADKIEPAVDEALALVRMSDFADRAVGQLSGGQQQRIAVARALVVEPDLLLLDEPFSALDRKLRETMQVELKSLLRKRGITAVFVTHDQDEALAVSDRIAVMNAGQIEHFADPVSLYEQPATPFALDFVGLSTRLIGTVRDKQADHITVTTAYGAVKAPTAATSSTHSRLFAPGQAVLLGVRPENIHIASPDAPSNEQLNRLKVELIDEMHLGARVHLHAEAWGDDRLLCELSSSVHAKLIGQPPNHWEWPVSSTLVYPLPDHMSRPQQRVENLAANRSADAVTT